MQIKSNDKLLEIGFGPGIGIQMISHSCESCTIHGIDFSKLMYKKAGKLNKTGIENNKVQLKYGDFLQIPFEESHYDKIFCLNVIYFWNELNNPFEKIVSLLKTGGFFHIYMFDVKTLIEKKAPDSIFNKYSLEHVVDVLKLTGFSEIEHYYKKGHFIKAKK